MSKSILRDPMARMFVGSFSIICGIPIIGIPFLIMSLNFWFDSVIKEEARLIVKVGSILQMISLTAVTLL